MNTECPNCKHCFQTVDVDGVMSERKLMREVIEAQNETAQQANQHEKLLRIFTDLDEIMHTMRPRWHGSPSMCGRYPCWIVWLPKEGTTERKTLKDAMIDFLDQSSLNVHM